MEIFIGTIVLIIAPFLLYVSSVVIEEEKRGKRIPLFWESDFWDNKDKN